MQKNLPTAGRSRAVAAATAAGLSAAVIAGFALNPGATASAEPPAHSVLGPSDPNWQKYVVGQGTDIQQAVGVRTTYNAVTNGAALAGGTGTATLTTTDSTQPATLILDWGTETAARFTVSVSSTSGTSAAPVSLKISTSETEWGLYSATSLAAPAVAGDTVIKVSSISGAQFEPGRTIQVGDVKRKIISVGTAGANGTGVILDEALPHGFVNASRTPVSVFAPARVSGDRGGQTQQIAGAGDVTFSNNFGGFRFQAIQLTTPGTITISKNTGAATSFVAPPEKYAGHFVSSDEQLNKMWYSGAFANARTMIPKAESGRPYAAMFDGAKRDRAVWSGDTVIQGPVAANAFGPVADEFYQGALRDLFDNSNPVTGKLAGTTWRSNIYFYSDSYSDYTAISAIEYFRYTGNRAFAEEFKSKIEGAVAYQKTKLNADGLVQNNPSDRDYWQAQIRGVASEYNVVYHQLLTLASWFETQLGDTAKAAEYQADADTLKTAMQAHLWSDELGAYVFGLDNDADKTTIPLDANANALREGLVPAGQTARLLEVLKGAWTDNGSKMTFDMKGSPSRQDPTGQTLEPLPNYWEVLGRYQAGDDDGAIKVARSWWGQQVDENNPYYTGATWEFVGDNGVMTRASASQSHGWGAGVTTALTEFTLGVQPVDAGYSTWVVDPHIGGLDWAEGSVPAADKGSIDVNWGKDDDEFDIKVTSPANTTGEVTIPLPAGDIAVTANGRKVFGYGNGKVTPHGDVTGGRVENGHLVLDVTGGSTVTLEANVLPGERNGF